MTRTPPLPPGDDETRLQPSRSHLAGRVTFDKSADVLEERAREILAAAGYPPRGTDAARGVAMSGEYAAWLGARDRSASRWDALDDGGSGLEAIEQLTLGPVGLMVLDLNMPDMHGLEVLKFVRRHPAYRALPVIVLTTRGDEASRDAAMAAGATVYLTKPFLPQVLAEHARTLFG